MVRLKYLMFKRLHCDGGIPLPGHITPPQQNSKNDGPVFAGKDTQVPNDGDVCIHAGRRKSCTNFLNPQVRSIFVHTEESAQNFIKFDGEIVASMSLSSGATASET